MELPFLYRGNEPLEIEGKVVFDLVSTLKEHGLEEEFLQEVIRTEVKFSVPAELVNLMKSYLFIRKMHKTSAVAEAVITSATCPKKPDIPGPV